MRIDKYLAGQGYGTRSEVKKLIKHGDVLVEGVPVKDAGFLVAEEKLQSGLSVVVQGKEVLYKKYRYYMLNKPAGVLTATEDREKKTVMDLLPFSLSEKRKLFPVGRLDLDTEGLLLITDDGELAHRLLSPKKHVDKCYYAVVSGIVTEVDVKAFEKGMQLSFHALPAKLEILSVEEERRESQVKVTIHEGKYHQIKRMFGAAGKEVLYLKRLSMGSLVLDETLVTGGFRELTEEEILQLQNLETVNN